MKLKKNVVLTLGVAIFCLIVSTASLAEYDGPICDCIDDTVAGDSWDSFTGGTCVHWFSPGDDAEIEMNDNSFHANSTDIANSSTEDTYATMTFVPGDDYYSTSESYDINNGDMMNGFPGGACVYDGANNCDEKQLLVSTDDSQATVTAGDDFSETSDAEMDVKLSHMYQRYRGHQYFYLGDDDDDDDDNDDDDSETYKLFALCISTY
jgi:hypothetical protein